MRPLCQWLVVLIALLAPGVAAAASSEDSSNGRKGTVNPGRPVPAGQSLCCRETANGPVPTTRRGEPLPRFQVAVGLGFLAAAGLIYWLDRARIPDPAVQSLPDPPPHSESESSR
jgi:hypothetical protein